GELLEGPHPSPSYFSIPHPAPLLSPTPPYSYPPSLPHEPTARTRDPQPKPVRAAKRERK
uniref:Uncharacterized protein n=1 Tax=Aegilops tauschii subsp. strangulata TaxID=200361 RepID=A0A453H7E1_AEGTS